VVWGLVKPIVDDIYEWEIVIVAKKASINSPKKAKMEGRG
jgi:hypothetical protein